PCFLSRSGCDVGTSLCDTILLYQSAMYRYPSGPNPILTGRNQSSSETNRSSKCSVSMDPSGLRLKRMQLIELVMGLARNPTSRHSAGKPCFSSSENASPESPVPPTRNACIGG